MPKRTTGRYERTTIGGEAIAAFVPHALPPTDPPLVMDAVLTERLRLLTLTTRPSRPFPRALTARKLTCGAVP
jgi:hypothetical protein